MNRRSSSIAVLGLLLIGIAICLRQTFNLQDSVESYVLRAFLMAEAVLGMIIGLGIVVLAKRRYRKGKRVNRPLRSAAFAPLRRLLAGVWS